jgi:hypothetical protein
MMEKNYSAKIKDFYYKNDLPATENAKVSEEQLRMLRKIFM